MTIVRLLVHIWVWLDGNFSIWYSHHGILGKNEKERIAYSTAIVIAAQHGAVAIDGAAVHLVARMATNRWIDGAAVRVSRLADILLVLFYAVISILRVWVNDMEHLRLERWLVRMKRKRK